MNAHPICAQLLHLLEIIRDLCPTVGPMIFKKPARFIVAFTHRPEGSLFFKIQGPDAAVTAQKSAFFEFLKTVKFAGGSPPAPAPAAEAKAWPGEVPAGWTEVAPGPMQQEESEPTPPQKE